MSKPTQPTDVITASGKVKIHYFDFICPNCKVKGFYTVGTTDAVFSLNHPKYCNLCEKLIADENQRICALRQERICDKRYLEMRRKENLIVNVPPK